MAKVPFLDIFPGCAGMEDLCGGLGKAAVSEVLITRSEMLMEVSAAFCRAPAQAELVAVESRIAEDYGLDRVAIKASFPRETEQKKGGGEVLMGRKVAVKTPTPIRDLTPDSGNVAVTGKVFFVESRDIAKRNATIFTFDLTDYTGSVRCTKFLKSDEEKVVIDKIREGDYVTVTGYMSYSKYEEDMVLEPKNVWKTQPEKRKDLSEEKHIELHLHTRFSNTDALTDPKALVKRAADWGMPAVAVTDHGVVQAFPDMWHAGKDYGVKIIYGVEGYYVDDMNIKQPVKGNSSLPLMSEFIAFDIETTGLSPVNDRMTEIGAILFQGGEIKEHFQCFVNPHMPIPADIKRLTGITDDDVKDAPDEDEAMRRFLEFAGGRPIIAHNADFDTSFMREACKRSDIPFHPVVIDTLVLSQCLLPDLKRFKLDIVSHKLKLPEFNHHRAYDDAAVVARIMAKFIPMLAERGARTVNDINGAVADLHRLDIGKTRHICLLARNKAGLKNLYKIISASQIEHYNKSRKHPTMPRSLIQQYREGIFVGSACEAGELYDAVLRGKPDAQLEEIASFYDYLEIMPLFNNRFLIENGTVKSDEDLKDINRKIIAIGKKLGKPVVATCDVHFLDPEDEIYRKILLSSKKFSDADKELPIYFRTTEEVMKEFEYLGEDLCREVVITNPQLIADQVEEFELLPKDLFAPKIENSKEELERLVMEKMHRIYGDNPSPIVTERVNTELKTILDHEYDVIYMSAQKLVQNSLEHGYLVGSRGSVGSSIVAYMSGITEVNSLPPHYICPNCKNAEFITDGSYGCGADMPDKICPVCGTKYRKDGFDIPFETFLGFPGNEKTPDIDLNFSGEYQANAHNYTRELFGSDHVFKAGTIGTLADKTAYGMVKKYLEEHDLHVTKAEENRLAKGCVGVKRTTGQHPGGLVIIPQDKEVTDFCPIQWAAEDPDCGIMTTHFEYHCMENNLLKLDELGHDDPTMIRMLEDMTGVNAQEIQLDDPETMGIFKSPHPLGLPDDDPIVGKTGTLGIPEFGTGFTRGMLVDTQPEQFDTLVRLAGLAHGTDVWNGNIHDIVVSGTATVNECVCCRDDIMLYLIQVGMEPSLAFKTMEAVRKGKVKKSGSFPGDAEAIMKDKNVPDWYIESCRKIAYLFPKAHAVAYVMMAFRIAWFKVHEPLAFYSAYFYRRSQKNSFDAELMTEGIDKVKAKINELRSKQTSATEDDVLTTLEVVYEFYLRGFSFAPMSVTESDATKFLIVDETHLRAPFVAISGLGEAAANDLAAAARSGGSFVSIEELSAACPKVSQTHLQTLKDMGALGDLPDTSQMTLF
ncbi:MAG: PolC-type DNA polymerase III [Oscillospiraceae bacterium]|nr:PolC-type DNA polymerase III [Oscillospiraceae bacterium]